MKITDDYAALAEDKLAASNETPAAHSILRRELLTAAQVYATLAVAAATREAASRPLYD